MGKLKSTQLHIARAVADVLSAPQATNKFYHSDLIAEIVNFVGGINDNNHLTGKIIAKAFAGDCSDDYEINYDDIELDMDDCEGIGHGDFYAFADELAWMVPYTVSLDDFNRWMQLIMLEKLSSKPWPMPRKRRDFPAHLNTV